MSVGAHLRVRPNLRPPAFRVLAKPVEFWYTDHAALLSLKIRQQREVSRLNDLFDFLLAVIAGIVSYYICKWLDGWRKGR
jgi:hypothetical protein